MNCYLCKEKIENNTKFVWARICFNNHGKRVIRPDTIEPFHITCAKTIPDSTTMNQDQDYYTFESSWVYGILQGGDV